MSRRPSTLARAFQLGLAAAAALVRQPLTRAAATRALAALGAALARRRGVRASADPRAMAEAWQRAFPSRKHVPIARVDATTAYAEILTPCPLRGSGDTAACWRLMAYDRAFAARAGARFVVLRSQATPGVERCQVALRALDLAADDLVPAHEPDLAAGRPAR
ncbi:MAG: hypothetical protein U1F43_09510 [Myxococcota bacterium]